MIFLINDKTFAFELHSKLKINNSIYNNKCINENYNYG